MSGVLGLIDFSGHTLPEGHLARMRNAMAYWGPDGGGLLEAGSAGLGHLKLLSLPESIGEKLPIRHSDTGLWYTASARLDDRDELCDALGIPHIERPTTPDTDILLHAWLTWGEDGLPNLRGDWSFALWDPANHRLVLARDPYGATALYYARADGRFAFASCKKALLALPELPKDPDELFLATILICGTQTGHDTAYRAIKCVPPAHLMVIEHRRERLTRYWRMEDVPDVRLSSDDAYVEAFLELFERAIKSRLRSVKPIGTTLSGGLDSGSITALAARQMGDAPLVAFTSVPIFQCPPDTGSRFRDEGPLARLTAGRYPNIDHVLVGAEKVSPLQGIARSLWIQDEPEHGAINQFWSMAIMHQAQQRGLGVLLVGDGGNPGMSWTGPTVNAFHLLCSGRLAKGLRDLTAWQRSHRASPWWTLRQQILRPLLLPLWVRRHVLRHPLTPPWQSHSLINPAANTRLHLRRVLADRDCDPYFANLLPGRQERIQMVEPTGPFGAYGHSLGAAFNMELRDPTLDLRLFSFCLGIPESQFVEGPVDRWLIRRAMAPHLPQEIAWNQRRGSQASDIEPRMHQDLGRYQEWLQAMSSLEACHHLIDFPRLARALESIQPGTQPSKHSELPDAVLQALGVGGFLAGLGTRT